MRHVLLVLVLSLVGCSDPVAFTDIDVLDLSDPIWAAKYAAMEACSGSQGAFGLARWHGIRRADVEGWSHWESPHDVYVFGRTVGSSEGAVEISSFHDGALRHILRTNAVPPSILLACDIPERVI